MAQKRRNRRDKKKNDKESERKAELIKLLGPSNDVTSESLQTQDMQVEYVSELDEKMLSGRHQVEFGHIFDKFKNDLATQEGDKDKNGEKKEGDAADGDKEKEEKEKMSKKKLKEINRMKVSELKQVVKQPDVVESWDVTAKDPLFLVWLKCIRNSVPVPKHWSQKRKFLQYKRGLHKTPFKLPEYIEDTGITKARESSNDANKTLKQRMKERMQPKTGKLDIDYQILHDAFFKHQTKPRLTVHGDVYYEGKEYEVKMRVYKPGRISPDLCHALGIPESSPPPWLINMQRFGPPPAYPSLKIPGVNAPIPDSMHYGQGKYIQDERGFTVYADCHGLSKTSTQNGQITSIYDQRKVTRTYWGQLKENEQSEADSESEELEEGMSEGYEDVGEYESDEDVDLNEGMASVVDNVQVGGVDIRKQELQRKADEMLGDIGEGDAEDEVKPLYRVLKEVDAEIKEGELMGAKKTYQYDGTGNADKVEKKEEDQAKETAEPEKPKKQKKEKFNYKF